MKLDCPRCGTRHPTHRACPGESLAEAARRARGFSATFTVEELNDMESKWREKLISGAEEQGKSILPGGKQRPMPWESES